MIVFEKDFFQEDYLNFADDFKIEINDKSKVIFAPNGTCKTTIYNCIKEKHPEFEFIDYEELKQSVIGNKRELIIGTNVLLLVNKQKEKNQQMIKLDIGKTIKGLGITNGTADKKISNTFKRSDDYFESKVLSFDEVGAKKYRIY